MRSRIVVFAAVLCLAAGSPGCSGRSDPDLNGDVNAPPRPPVDPIDRRLVEVTGVLTDEGVECPALRTGDGTLYTLAGDLEEFKVGDRVRVTGRIAEVSICQQGTTLEVVAIEEER
jgi:hypothetical protein